MKRNRRLPTPEQQAEMDARTERRNRTTACGVSFFLLSIVLFGCHHQQIARKPAPAASVSPAPAPLAVPAPGKASVTPTTDPTPAPITRETFEQMIQTGKRGIAELDAVKMAKAARHKREMEAAQKAKVEKQRQDAAEQAKNKRELAKVLAVAAALQAKIRAGKR